MAIKPPNRPGKLVIGFDRIADLLTHLSDAGTLVFETPRLADIVGMFLKLPGTAQQLLGCAILIALAAH